ncbi:MAG: LysM peptidoglycan-binding domain-containing protein [Coriobacteriia bacterium]|nr:LysM peptidoglycan-binding domain-containing protein [Coriobacteriia bacterium]
MSEMLIASAGLTALPTRTSSEVRFSFLPKVLIGLLVTGAIAVAALSAVVRPVAPEPPAWHSISVDAHSTLWEIATAHPVDDLGTSATVELIRTENALRSSTIHAGQTLRVPGPSPSAVAVAQR